MNNIINFQYVENCISFNDLANFISTYDYTLPSILLTNGLEPIINRPISDIKKEILSASGYLSKVNTQSVFAKLKVDIDIPASQLTTFKDILQYIFSELNVVADFTNYTVSHDFKGMTYPEGDFVEFEKVSAMEMILYALAIDGYIMLLRYDGTIFFETEHKNQDITIEGVRNLSFKSDKKKIIEGLTIYNCDEKTDDNAILAVSGNGKVEIIHRIFGTGAEIYANDFANRVYNAFNSDILQVEFESKNYYPLGGVFYYQNLTIGIDDEFMILSKTSINDGGAWLYKYTAIKKSQCVQMYLQQSIFDKLISRNNFKVTDMIKNEEDSLEVLRDDMSILSYHTEIVAGKPRIVIKFNKKIKDAFNPENFKLWW